tara:strand:- start:5226 stop:5570 length:345 start_codon:yes stop_codon:yes gene_type:complete
MSERNLGREIVQNSDEGYKEILEKRGLTSIKQYAKLKIPYLSEEDRRGITTVKHIYKTGDKLYKISHEYYGDARYWWVLAWWNRKPTDFHCNIGDTIYIPLPLKEALYLATSRD